MYKITIQNESQEPLKLEIIESALAHVLKAHALPQGEVSVLISDNQKLRELNSQFRNIDEPTDVLTFPAPLTAQGQIGDIAVSIDFARRAAALRSVPIENETAMLVVHAALHLAGFDDQTVEERQQIVKIMNEHAELLGLETDENWSSLPHGEEV